MWFCNFIYFYILLNCMSQLRFCILILFSMIYLLLFIYRLGGNAKLVLADALPGDPLNLIGT